MAAEVLIGRLKDMTIVTHRKAKREAKGQNGKSGIRPTERNERGGAGSKPTGHLGGGS